MKCKGMTNNDKKWMNLALREAKSAAECGDVPVGAVVVYDGRVVSRAQNRVERLKDPTAHAEMLAIREASMVLGYERLLGASLYVTLEPCTMCAGAIILARLKKLVYGAADPKTGACGSLNDFVRDGRLNHRVEVTGGTLGNSCSKLLRDFFREVRELNNNRIKSNLPERCESG